MTDKDKAGTRSENVSKDGEFGEIKRSFLYGKHPSPFSHEYEQEWFFEAGRQVERDAHAELVKPIIEAAREAAEKARPVTWEGKIVFYSVEADAWDKMLHHLYLLRPTEPLTDREGEK